jgi:hypothetical protein
LIVALEAGIEQAAFRDWLEANSIAVLNVAGPRESQRPGVYEAAVRGLEAWLRVGFPREWKRRLADPTGHWRRAPRPDGKLPS